ncbi:MAG: Hsp20/alpha crystallin family protein [Candidatus Caenarcaniphilales bacterium]|nr:Hsp20/alpha crystallin family protein [Candidatus Caenarcaniphilales bacterium]
MRDLTKYQEAANHNSRAISRLSPFVPTLFSSYLDSIDEIFDSFFDRRNQFRRASKLGATLDLFDSERMPRIEIQDSEDNLDVIAEVPGMDEKDLEINILPDRMLIKGKQESSKAEEKDGSKTWYRRFGSFVREIPLTYEVDKDKVKAEYKNGVLKIHAPKSVKEISKAVKIEINK